MLLILESHSWSYLRPRQTRACLGPRQRADISAGAARVCSRINEACLHFCPHPAFQAPVRFASLSPPTIFHPDIISCSFSFIFPFSQPLRGKLLHSAGGTGKELVYACPLTQRRNTRLRLRERSGKPGSHSRKGPAWERLPQASVEAPASYMSLHFIALTEFSSTVSPNILLCSIDHFQGSWEPIWCHSSNSGRT